MSNAAIWVEGLGKEYRLGAAAASGAYRYKSLRDSITNMVVSPLRRLGVTGRDATVPGGRGPKFWALDDVTFEVKHGEVLGIIGRNGAGKSTLLKLLSRITEPTTGRISINGRVASLLEVGTGFHPDLTGRENVFLNGAILGLSRADIVRRFDEIVAFAEVEQFIDTQVKYYSSGMYLRLAFAVAAHLEPEILIVDEVLAVGDVAFQKKCLGKMGEASLEGRTVLLVSHQMAAIESLCSRAMMLDRGRVVQQGDVQGIISQYLHLAYQSLTTVDLAQRVDRTGSGQLLLTGLHLENSRGETVPAARSGQDLVFVLSFVAKHELSHVDVGLSLHEESGRTISVLYAEYVNQVFAGIPERGQFRCSIPHFPLAPGKYILGARVVVNGVEADWPRDGIGFVEVEEGDFYGTGRSGFLGKCLVMLKGDWSVDSLA